MTRVRAKKSRTGHKWYDAAPNYKEDSGSYKEDSGSDDAQRLSVGGGTAGGINYATGRIESASPTSYGIGRRTVADPYTNMAYEYSGGPFGYRDAPVDFKTTDRLGAPTLEPLGSPFASTDFIRDETGTIRTISAEQAEAGLAPGQEFVTSGEAALAAPIGAVGTANPAALDLIDMLAGGTGFATGFLGPTVVGARGQETAVGSGLPGIFGREKIKKDYEVFENIKAGNPGYHQFYMGNQLVSIAPNEGFMKENLGLGNEFVVYGNIDLDTAKQVIGGAKGFDPRTIDFNKTMDDEGFGTRLRSFIPDVGGLTRDNKFVGSDGVVRNSIPNPTTYAGLLATSLGNQTAAAELTGLAQVTGSSRMAELAQQAARGELSAREYRDDNGQVIGFETPTGGYVTNKQGDPVRTGSGGYATYGTGPASAEAVLGNRLGDLSGDSGVGIGDFGTEVSGYTTRSGRDDRGDMSGDSGVGIGDFGTEVSGYTTRSGRDDRGDSGLSSTRDFGGSGGFEGSRGVDENRGPGGQRSSSDTFFADGGRVGKKIGGEAVAESGFIVQPPNEVGDSATVADDVPMDVEEGAFIVNAAAIEFMGIADFQKMIEDAREKARELGIDIPENSGKMGDGEVPLAVSRGEGYISEPLAKIIGYDKLNKINNRGKKEVAERIEEAEQPPEQNVPTDAMGRPMSSGGFAIQGSGSTGGTEFSDYSQVNLQAEYKGDGFLARPRINYSEQQDTQAFPDGVVVDNSGKNIGFAVDGQMFLKDDRALRAGFERQASQSKQSVKLPGNNGGETLEFGGGSKMKRYSMGATFGPLDVDISKTQLPNDDVVGGSVTYRFSEDGDVTLEASDDGRSGRIGLNYRF